MKGGVSVCALYPELLNIYADRGNLLVLEKRCLWRGIGFSLTAATLGEPLPRGQRLYYIGGGQDRDQALCAQDLVKRKGAALLQEVEAGAVVLAVCGGYQLLGKGYRLGDGSELKGVGVFSACTVQENPRLIGNVAIETEPGIGGGVLAGFENHGGRTRLDPGQQPLGRVLRGHGNDGESGLEGAVTNNAFGTYLHGPLLPKNHWFADELIARALAVDRRELKPLDDSLEEQAHRAALRAAGLGGRV